MVQFTEIIDQYTEILIYFRFYIDQIDFVYSLSTSIRRAYIVADKARLQVGEILQIAGI